MQRTAVGLELVAQPFAVTHQAMTTSRQTLSIYLVTVQQPGLHHPITTVYLQHQTVDIWHQFFCHFVEVSSNDATQQQTTQTRSRIHRQDQIAERQSSCRRLGTRMEDLYFRKEL